VGDKQKAKVAAVQRADLTCQPYANTLRVALAELIHKNNDILAAANNQDRDRLDHEKLPIYGRINEALTGFKKAVPVLETEIGHLRDFVKKKEGKFQVKSTLGEAKTYLSHYDALIHEYKELLTLSKQAI
jgi:hypothetical protein